MLSEIETRPEMKADVSLQITQSFEETVTCLSELIVPGFNQSVHMDDDAVTLEEHEKSSITHTHTRAQTHCGYTDLRCSG